MNFIKLTETREGNPIFVDMDKAITLEITKSNATFIQFFNGKEDDYIYVKESPEEILKLIKEAKND